MAQANWKLPLQEFKAWIWEERVTGSRNTDDPEDFIPAGDVRAYLDQPGKLKGILTALLGESGRHINLVQLKARYSVVFAILVFIDRGEYIGNFIHHDALSDARLPFAERPTRFPLDRGAPDQGDAFFDHFSSVQARFCAPRFEPGYHKFEMEERLPFLEKVFIDDGGSAKVYRIELHAEHDFLHESPSDSESDRPNLPKHHKIYALKAYHGEEGDFLHSIETATFGKLKRTGLDTAHIIGYHCSFEHRNVRYALLEYADKHTLEDFMMDKDSIPPLLDQEILSFWENVLLVVVGILALHDFDSDGDGTLESGRFTGIHQDIKPKNILVKTKEHASSDYDSWLGLADLGTSSLVRAKSNTASRDNFGTKTYGSPECFRRDSIDDDRNIKITTAADIWSFGCVLSEVCIWVVFGSNGPHGLRSYRQRRADNNMKAVRGADCFHLNGQTSQVVLEEHAKVAAQRKCDDITRAVLELMPKMLHLDPKRRPSAKKLRDYFVDIIDKAKAGIDSKTPRSIYKLHTRTMSGSTTQSSTPSSPLEQVRVKRRTVSASQSPNDANTSHRMIFPGTLPTATPETYAREGDNADLAAHAVSSPLPAQHARNGAVDQRISHTPDSGKASPHHNLFLHTGQDQAVTKRAPQRSAEVIEDRDAEPGCHNEAQNGADMVLTPVLRPAGAPQTPKSPVTVDGPTAGTIRHPVSSEPKIPWTPPYRLDFSLALKWRRERKIGKSSIKLPNESLFNQLTGRDHVFVIDDCKSMGELFAASRAKHESDIADYVDVLSYIVKRRDPDGIDLHYFNSADVITRCRDTTTLVTSVNNTSFAGSSTPEVALKGLLRAYLGKVTEYRAKLRAFETRGRRSLFGGIPKLPTPLSVYVLTDGVWELPSTAGGGYLEDTIKDLIEGLRSAGCGRDQVGIQFIRFGSHEHGVQRLESLDRLGRAHDIGMDIVDTEPVEGGNVFKMLLGAINPRFDGDPDVAP